MYQFITVEAETLITILELDTFSKTSSFKYHPFIIAYHCLVALYMWSLSQQPQKKCKNSSVNVIECCYHKQLCGLTAFMSPLCFNTC